MGDPEQLFLSFLGASVSPYLFAPMLEGVFSADVLAHRNAYLRALLERILG